MESFDFPSVDLAYLRSTLGEPEAPTTQKITNFLDENCLTFLAHSPFCSLATADAAAARNPVRWWRRA